VHIKACPARGYIPRAWGQAKMRLYLCLGRYTQVKAYYPISLLYFMQKTMQKLATRNIKDGTLRHVPYIYNKCLQTIKVQRNCNAPCDYTYTGRSGKEEVTHEHA
jgi:hypothetical protein